MTDFEKKIISELKQALEFKEINNDYSQRLQGVSLPTIIERKNNHLSLTARVVVKTSTSDLVDGMDIDFTLEPLMDPSYYENSPNFMGGSIASSQVWLKSHGKLILEQLSISVESSNRTGYSRFFRKKPSIKLYIKPEVI